jgi:hypothetical protein
MGLATEYKYTASCHKGQVLIKQKEKQVLVKSKHAHLQSTKRTSKCKEEAAECWNARWTARNSCVEWDIDRGAVVHTVLGKDSRDDAT